MCIHESLVGIHQHPGIYANRHTLLNTASFHSHQTVLPLTHKSLPQPTEKKKKTLGKWKQWKKKKRPLTHEKKDYNFLKSANECK